MTEHTHEEIVQKAKERYGTEFVHEYSGASNGELHIVYVEEGAEQTDVIDEDELFGEATDRESE